MLLNKAGDFSRLVEVGMSYYCKKHNQNQNHDSQYDCKTYVFGYYASCQKDNHEKHIQATAPF